MTSRYAEMARSFEAQDLDPAAFRHGDHVCVAYEMLRTYDFVDAAARYAGTIKSMAARAGVHDKFNATITLAFLSLIAERMGSTEHSGYDDFISRNQDLLSKDVLQTWYSPERLRSDLARSVFLMPDIPGRTA